MPHTNVTIDNAEDFADIDELRFDTSLPFAPEGQSSLLPAGRFPPTMTTTEGAVGLGELVPITDTLHQGLQGEGGALTAVRTAQ